MSHNSVENFFFCNIEKAPSLDFKFEIDYLAKRVVFENFHLFLNEFRFKGWSSARFHNGKFLDKINQKMFYTILQIVFNEKDYYRHSIKYDNELKKSVDSISKVDYNFSFEKAYKYLFESDEIGHWITDDYILLSSKSNWIMIISYDLDSMYFFYKNEFSEILNSHLILNKNFVNKIKY